jgi:hypothetical protein
MVLAIAGGTDVIAGILARIEGMFPVLGRQAKLRVGRRARLVSISSVAACRHGLKASQLARSPWAPRVAWVPPVTFNTYLRPKADEESHHFICQCREFAALLRVIALRPA